ncbi:MAG: hypothetical protein FJW30_07195 [Acidobacteria bacterium]|nr:hypothetical protein [Acidobacteriota bacterium]
MKLSRRQFLASLPAAAAQSRKPNLVLVITDDHHWQCLGVAGNPKIETPNMDRLARRGVYFPDFILSTSQCAPCRGILLSGLEGFQSGLDSNGHTAFTHFRGQTVPAQLRQAGYETHLVGKWHVAPLPEACGFAHSPLWLRGGGSPYINPKLRHGLTATEDRETPGHITTLLTDAAVGVIEKAKSPYLLWLAYNAPHEPWTASESFMAKYAGRNATLTPPNHPRTESKFDWATYYAVITELDAHIGRVADAIEKAGQWENTLLIVMGDNGYLAGTKGLNGKVHAWETSLRAPFLAAGGPVKTQGPNRAAVASIDVPATLLDYAGVRSSHTLSGTSLRGALSGGKFPRQAAFSCWNDGRPEGLAIRVAVEPYRAVRTATHKYVLWESKKEALFDLRNDPHEETDLAPNRPPELRAMRSRLRARMKVTNDPAIAWLG